MNERSYPPLLGQDATHACIGPWRQGEGVLHFGDQAAEYRALTAGVGICDLSDRTQLECRGTDRATFLHGFCTNDVRKLSPGSGCEAFVTSVQGKTLGHVRIYCGEESLIIETAPGQADKLLAHWDRYLIREDVTWIDRSAAWGEILVAGTGARQVLESMGTGHVPANRCEHGPWASSDGVVWLRKEEAFGSQAWCLAAARERLTELWRQLRETGAIPAGRLAVEQLRLEAGWPELGVDFDDTCLPQEIGRDAQAISFTKGCYLGQETVARIDALGHVNRRLVLVRFHASDVPPPGTALQVGDQQVGRVTSSAWSPRLAAPLAWAWVPRGLEAPASQLDSASGQVQVVRPPA